MRNVVTMHCHKPLVELPVGTWCREGRANSGWTVWFADGFSSNPPSFIVVCVFALAFLGVFTCSTLPLGAACSRFPVGEVKELIRQVLREHLAEKQTFGSETSKEIADEIKNKLKGACCPYLPPPPPVLGRAVVGGHLRWDGLG